VAFDLVRVMRSRYRIDAYQETYFVVDSFQQLFDATRPDFTPIYRQLGSLEDLPADAALPEDRLVPPGG
jgi:phenylalanine-4-hydroxylase